MATPEELQMMAAALNSKRLYMAPTNDGAQFVMATPQDVDAVKKADPSQKSGWLMNTLSSPATHVTVNSMFNIAELAKRGSGALKGVAKFVPGWFNSALTIGGDAFSAVTSAVAGDGKGVIKSSSRAIGGMGGIWAGAATGAAICSVVPGIGTVFGFVVGGVCTAVGGWLGGLFGGSVADGIVGDTDAEKLEKLQKRYAALRARGPIEVDHSIGLIMVDNMARAQQQASQNVAFNGNTVNTSVGALNDANSGTLSANVAAIKTRQSSHLP